MSKGYYLYAKLLMRNTVTLFILIFFSMQSVAAHGVAQDTTSLKRLLREIARENVYMASPLPGPHDKTAHQYFRYERLKSAAAFDLLQIAHTHSNAVVRLYAFRALTNKMDNIPAELAFQFKQDKTLVLYQRGKRTEKIPVNVIANGFLR